MKLLSLVVALLIGCTVDIPTEIKMSVADGGIMVVDRDVLCMIEHDLSEAALKQGVILVWTPDFCPADGGGFIDNLEGQK